MESQVMPASNEVPQNSLLAAMMTNTQQSSNASSTPLSNEPFAELLQNLFVEAGNTPGAGVNQANSPDSKSSKTILAGGHDNKSAGPSCAQDGTSNLEQGSGLNYSNLTSLMLGMMQPISPLQSIKKSADSNVSTFESSHPLAAKMEQRLAALLTASQNPIDATEPGSNQPYLSPTNESSKASDSGKDFLSMLYKRAVENPVVKENLLKFLSGAPNSSINRNYSAEVEKILAGISSLGTKSNKANFQADASQDSSASESQIAMASQKQEESTGLSTKILAEGKSSSISGNRNLESASILQSATNSSNVAAKLTDVHDGHNIAASGSTSSASDKTGSKISAAVSKEGSQKSDYDSANLIKQNMAEIYRSVSVDPKIDSRFGQELTSAVENSHDTPSTKPDVSEVAQTLIREAKMMSQENKTVMNVKLEPESLGSVVLRVASDNGKISAEFNVKTSDAQVYLENSIPQMKQMLQSNGVSLSHLSVNLSGGESQTRRQQSPAKKNPQKFSTEIESGPADVVRTFGYNTMEVKV